jgi:hypothetical protein
MAGNFLFYLQKLGSYTTYPERIPKVPRGIGRRLKLIHPFPRNEVTPYWLSHKSNYVSSENVSASLYGEGMSEKANAQM